METWKEPNKGPLTTSWNAFLQKFERLITFEFFDSLGTYRTLGFEAVRAGRTGRKVKNEGGLLL
jgi:hypothetical protein